MNRVQMESLIKRAYHEGFKDGVRSKSQEATQEDEDSMIRDFLSRNEPSVLFRTDPLHADGQTSASRNG